MLDDIAGTYGSRLFVAAGGVAVALLVLVGVLWLVRNRAPSPFVRGGKGRQQRLQVLDAAAIDARRRIVLIRRDGVEHLVMIGGPTDIVIESGIGDTSKIPVSQQLIASPLPLEAIAPKEPPRAPQQLAAPPEAPRVANRQPAPAAQLTAPSAQASTETPGGAASERLVRPEPVSPPVKPVAAAPASALAPPPVAAAAPAVTPPPPPTPVASAERPQPAAPAPAPSVQAAPQRIEPSIFDSTEAADILDAARNRVLPPQPERPVAVAAPQPQTQSQSPAAPMLARDAYNESLEVSAAESPAPRKPASDFENILEAEMNRLEADRAPPPVAPVTPPAPARPAPDVIAQQRRDPEMVPPIAGGDAALQKEVARIFGEISVDRDR